MNNFKMISTQLWIYIMCPVYSFFVNVFYWIFNFGDLAEAKKRKEEFKALELEKLISRFKWINDDPVDWYPWIITIINKDLEDDCDGAAILAKWWYKEHNIDSKLVFIYSDDGELGHAICVKNDNSQFVSNKEVINLVTSNWRQEIFDKFDNKYSVMIEKK